MIQRIFLVLFFGISFSFASGVSQSCLHRGDKAYIKYSGSGLYSLVTYTIEVQFAMDFLDFVYFSNEGFDHLIHLDADEFTMNFKSTVKTHPEYISGLEFPDKFISSSTIYIIDVVNNVKTRLIGDKETQRKSKEALDCLASRTNEIISKLKRQK